MILWLFVVDFVMLQGISQIRSALPLRHLKSVLIKCDMCENKPHSYMWLNVCCSSNAKCSLLLGAHINITSKVPLNQNF